MVAIDRVGLVPNLLQGEAASMVKVDWVYEIQSLTHILRKTIIVKSYFIEMFLLH